jgi:hypothetical protein
MAINSKKKKKKTFNEWAKPVYHVLALIWNITLHSKHSWWWWYGASISLHYSSNKYKEEYRVIWSWLLQAAKTKDDLHRPGIRRETVAVKETDAALSFLLLFLSLTYFVPLCLFSFLLTSFFSPVFSPVFLFFLSVLLDSFFIGAY